tara:strand:- start:350 stop:643 length:294 start_codon:yes stop_codon:yes gene_type:complete
MINTKQLHSIINILLSEANEEHESWKERWDNHYGDLSAPEFENIMARRNLLLSLSNLIQSGNRRNDNYGADPFDDKGRDFRERDLFAMSKEQMKHKG